MKAKSLVIGFIIVIFFLVASCSSKDPISIDITETNFINQSNLVLKGDIIDFDAMGADDICICDSIILVFSKNPASQLCAYDLNDMTLVAKMCSKGRAANEMIDPSSLSSQYYKRNGDLIVPVIDNHIMLKEINITKSIERHTTVIEHKSDCISTMEGNFVLVDNDPDKRFEYREATVDDVYSNKITNPSFYIREKGKEKRKFKYNQLMKGNMNYAASFCYGSLYKHPSKNLIIQPLQYLDYILFFDLDNKREYGIHQVGSLSFSDEAPKKAMIHLINYVATSEDFFMIMHINHDSNTSEDNLSPNELLVFDWSGMLIGSARMDHIVNRLAFDARNNNLYGLSVKEEKLYRFNLDELLPRN